MTNGESSERALTDELRTVAPSIASGLRTMYQERTGSSSASTLSATGGDRAIRVGINARTFCVDEPSGAVQMGIQTTRQFLSRPDVAPTLFGSSALTSQFDSAYLDDTLYPSCSQEYGVIWERTVLPFRARARDIDVLFCPNGNGPLHASSAYETVLHVHDVSPQRGMASSIQQAYRRATVPRAARAADLVTTDSEFSKSEIVDVVGISPEKIRVVHCGIDDLYRSADPGDPFDLPERYVLFVGALNPRKNVSRLLQAFDQLKSTTDLPHKLVLIGPRNKKIFQNLEIEATDDVLLPGFVTERELKYAYRNADLFAYPSLYEGFGLPPVEAMACGTPVLSSTVSSLPEVIGDAGELADPTSTDAIARGMERVLCDREYRDRLVDRGRERAERFTWERTADEFIHLLEEIVYARR